LQYPAISRGRFASVLVGFLLVTATFRVGPEAAFGQTDDTSPISLRGSIVAGGIGAFAENRWALVRANVINHTDVDREVRVVYSFDIEPDRQFVRRTWVPANARRLVEWPARLAMVGEADKSADGRAMVLDADSETSYSDQPGTVIVLRDEGLTAMIASSDEAADRAIDGVIAAREAAGLSRRLIYPGRVERHGPRYTLGWEPARVVVLATPTFDLDPAQRRAFRRWVRSGGTLWVMADRAQLAGLTEVLGDDWGISEIDRVGLNDVRFAEGAAADAEADRSLHDQPVVREQPIEMVRVVAPAYRTILNVRGWPALLERAVGGGRIIVTTVDARGWNTPEAREATRRIADTVYRNKVVGVPANPEGDVAARMIDAQIGYQIASRPTIAGVLGIYTIVILLAGLFLLARGRGEWIGPGGVAAAIVATLLLGGIGLASRGQVEPTAATFQTVHVDPGSSVATVTGAVGLFAPFEREATLASQRGGWAWPTDRTGAGATRRLMWTDLDYWTWQRLPLSGGRAERMDFATTAEFPEQVAVDLRYGEAGLSGELDTGSDVALRDVVLLTGQAAMGVAMAAGEATRQIDIPTDAVLPAGTYLTSDVLTVTQQRRNSVLDDIARARSPLDPPVILGWSGLVDDGLDSDADMPARGQALWHIPLNVAAAAPGDRVTVPWPLVTLTPVRDVEGSRRGGLIYNPQTGEWLATSLPGSFTARFDLPEAVTPLRIDAATLVLDISAVNRPVAIERIVDGRRIELARLLSPDGPQRVDLPTEQFGSPVESLVLAIDVGDLTDPNQGMESQSAMWKINRVGLEVRGAVGR